MLSTRKFIFYFFLILSLVLSESPIFCQHFIIIDTTDYLPYYYDGALDNNLMVAASRGYVEQIEKLIARGADVNAETAEGATPLVFAVFNDQAESVKKLLEYDPEIDKLTAADETPLIISVKNRNPEIAEILIRGGAEIDLPNSKGVAPIHYSALNGDLEMTDLLVYYGCDINLKSADGTSPLMASIWAGHQDVSDYLIRNGANLEARDRNGFTPLLIAAQNGDTLLINLVLKQGVDLYEKNNFNYNALDIAIESNQKNAVETLLEKGDKWTASEKGGLNPYSIAASFGRKDIITLLEQKKLPGRIGFRIDEISVSPSVKLNNHDFYTGGVIMFREPVMKAGLKTGFDLKPAYSRVLVKKGENLFYQYYDKSSVIYAGFFKDFTLRESFSGTIISASAAFSAGFSFGPEFRGTRVPAEEKIRIIPSAGLKLQKKHFTATADLEYMKTQFYGISPLWFRAGFSYNYFISKVRSPGKTIKWN